MLIVKDKQETPESTQICILYDPQSGSIAHTHRVVTFRGGRRLLQKEVEARTLQLATRLGWNATELKVLHVTADDLEPTKSYKVDPQSLRLLSLPDRILPKGRKRAASDIN